MTHLKFSTKPFQGGINNLFEDIVAGIPDLFNHEIKGTVPVNIRETGNSYLLEVIAPGFNKTDFKVNLDQNLLTISAEKQPETELPKGVKQIRKEFEYRTFKRTFTVDDKIDSENIEASYVNGVLTLNLPKKETVKASAKEIMIK